ncbi:MAG: hypothetical protein SPI65_00140 [Peptoniphilus sp.]|nr:hypothetical protein [Peptoniphilus sp.]
MLPVFLFLDIFYLRYATFSSGLKFMSIVLLFLAQCLWGETERGWWKAAAGLTILTDYLLLFTDCYEWGIFFFNVVHFFRYVERKRGEDDRALYFAGISGVGLMFLLSRYVSWQTALAAAYGLFLFLNTWEAFRSGNRELALAYCLFWGCDICVGVANVLSPGLIATISRKLIWLFYLPSQILLADHIIGPPRRGLKAT